MSIRFVFLYLLMILIRIFDRSIFLVRVWERCLEKEIRILELGFVLIVGVILCRWFDFNWFYFFEFIMNEVYG